MTEYQHKHEHDPKQGTYLPHPCKSFHFWHKVPQLQVLWVVRSFVITFLCEDMMTSYGGITENLDCSETGRLRSILSTPTCISLPFNACREWGSAPPPDLPFFPGHVLTLLRFIFARVSQSPAQTYWTLSWEPSRPCCVYLILDRQIRLSLISMTAGPWKWVQEHHTSTTASFTSIHHQHPSPPPSSANIFDEEQCYHAKLTLASI